MEVIKPRDIVGEVRLKLSKQVVINVLATTMVILDESQPDYIQCVKRTSSIENTTANEGSVEVFTSNTHPSIYIIRSFIYLATHCHSDILVTLHSWHTTIPHISSLY